MTSVNDVVHRGLFARFKGVDTKRLIGPTAREHMLGNCNRRRVRQLVDFIIARIAILSQSKRVNVYCRCRTLRVSQFTPIIRSEIIEKKSCLL